MDNKSLACGVDKIYQELNTRFGGQNELQIFTMLFPTQPLNYRDFVYDVVDRNSVLNKPQAVAEAEFRLADQLIEPAPVVGGDNGKQLSIVYEQLLDNYVPNMARLAPYLFDRAQFHEFLEKPIRIGDTTTTRMDLFNQYFAAYTEVKANWANEKSEKKKNAADPDDDFNWDDFAAWVATMSPAEHAKLDASYSMIVTKGYLHETFAILGYLNSASPAESLERAKQSLRHSGRGSTDETGTVYPVLFQPSNWFQAVKPNINPEDLTMAADAIISSLRARREQLATAKKHLATLQTINMTDEQRDVLKDNYDAAKQVVDEKENELIKKYGQGTMNMVKSVMRLVKGPIDRSNPASLTNTKALLAATGHKYDVIEEGLINAINDTLAVRTAQTEHFRAIEDSEEAQRLWQRAQTADFKLQIQHAEDRVSNLEAEIHDLEELVISVNSSKATEGYNTEGWESMLKDGNEAQILAAFKDVLQAAYGGTDNEARYSEFRSEYPNDKEIGAAKVSMPDTFAQLEEWPSDNVRDVGVAVIGDKLAKAGRVLSGNLPRNNLSDEMEAMFTTITVNVSATDSSSYQTEASASSQSNWRVSGWFASYNDSLSSSSSSSYAATWMQQTTTTIAMRVMKVNFVRPWFQASLLEKAGDFTNISESIRAGMGLNKGHILEAMKDSGAASHVEKLKKAAKAAGNKTFLLPAFPVAMLIAKDITIKMSSDSNVESSWNSASRSSSASSGGFLMFGGSSSNSSARSSSSSFSSAVGKDVVIRIPGPHILGYINQLVPADKSSEYEALTTDKKVTLDEVLKRYDQIFESLHHESEE